jgi:hypothetical protein
MRRRHLLQAIVVLFWLATGYALWHFAGEYFAPDACLDRGGSFNYLAWECSMEVMSQYIDIPIYQVAGFATAAATLTAAMLASVALRLTRRSTRASQGGAC